MLAIPVWESRVPSEVYLLEQLPHRRIASSIRLLHRVLSSLFFYLLNIISIRYLFPLIFAQISVRTLSYLPLTPYQYLFIQTEFVHGLRTVCFTLLGTWRTPKLNLTPIFLGNIVCLGICTKLSTRQKKNWKILVYKVNSSLCLSCVNIFFELLWNFL